MLCPIARPCPCAPVHIALGERGDAISRGRRGVVALFSASIRPHAPRRRHDGQASGVPAPFRPACLSLLARARCGCARPLRALVAYPGQAGAGTARERSIDLTQVTRLEGAYVAYLARTIISPAEARSISWWATTTAIALPERRAGARPMSRSGGRPSITPIPCACAPEKTICSSLWSSAATSCTGRWVCARRFARART